MKLGRFEIGAGALVEVAYAAFQKIRNRPKAVARRARKAAKRPGRAVDETAEDFNSLDEVRSMDAVKGALKSKLVWLGLAQIAYSLFEAWANGGLNAESVSTAVSGALTIVFRAVTSESLADKAQPK